MYDTWKANSRTLLPLTAEDARAAAGAIEAKVLSNRKPPFSLAGGLFDALSDTCGDMYCITNEELAYWQEKFEELEGTDIHPAAAVAVASLAKAVKVNTVKADEVIMLNITGGGEKRAKSGKAIYHALPHLVISPEEPVENIVAQVKKLFE